MKHHEPIVMSAELGVASRDGGHVYEDVSGTLRAEPGGISYNCNNITLILTPIEIILRRLTPNECARLQGMPDWFCDGLGIENPTEEEMEFWRGVFKTYSAATGCKMKSDTQIRKWLSHPNSDSSEYKMWGNGMALPCVLYVMEGVKQALEEE